MDKKEIEPQNIVINKKQEYKNIPLEGDKPIENNLHEQALSDAQISKLKAIKSELEPKDQEQKVQASKIMQYPPQNQLQPGSYPPIGQNSLQNNWNSQQKYQNNNNFQNNQRDFPPFGYQNYWEHQNNRRLDYQEYGSREHHGYGRRGWHGHRGHHGHYGHHGFPANQFFPQSNIYGYPPPPPVYPPFHPPYGFCPQNNFSLPNQAPFPGFNPRFQYPPPPPEFQQNPYHVFNNQFAPPPPQVQQIPYPVFNNQFIPPPPSAPGQQMYSRHHRGRGCHGRGDKHHRKGRKGSDSSSSSSSSSQKSNHKSKCKKWGWKGKQKYSVPLSEETEKYEKQIYEYYSKQMNGFFQSRQINQLQRDKIINLLKRSYPAFEADINKIIKCLQQIEQQNLTFRMSYVKIIKVLIKFRLDLRDAKQKLQHIQHKKIKKYEADQKFEQTYGGKVIPPMMEVSDLISLSESNEANTLYIVDGNNIMPTNKHLRKYFQNRNHLYKISAQLRCKWYFSHVFNKQNIILFFDEKFSKQDEDQCKKVIFDSGEQQKRAMDLQVIYGQNEKADEKIIDKLISLVQNNDKRQIVLVTADRDLTMRCQEIKIILYTAGRHFFKFCKYKINRSYKDKKPMKRLAKSILEYQQLY